MVGAAKDCFRAARVIIVGANNSTVFFVLLTLAALSASALSASDFLRLQHDLTSFMRSSFFSIPLLNRQTDPFAIRSVIFSDLTLETTRP